MLAAILRGNVPPWRALAMTSAQFVSTCRDEGITGLVYERMRTRSEGSDWPPEVGAALAAETRVHTASELLRQRELVTVFNELAAHHVDAIVLKGTGLAYTVYANPASRSRVDTDLLIRREHEGDVRRVMGRLGYTAPPHCEGDFLFCQFPLKKIDTFGRVHVVDCHWKISTQSMFADVLAFDEIAVDAVDVPELGAHARTAGPLHALLLACIHPVMHHRNDDSLIWMYDIHLLASRLSADEFDRFADLARVKQVAAICAHQLRAAHERLGTRTPDAVMATLSAVGDREPSAAYLKADRRWSDELISSIRGLTRWGDRLRLLREVALPGPAYMLKAYNLVPSALGTALLPVLYLHRLAAGGWKVLTRQK